MSCTGMECTAPTTGVAQLTFAASLQFFAATQCLISENWPADASTQDSETFDFIIVGGGSAGSVVANRLSENENWKILLIEAGDDPPVESIIPGLYSTLLGSKYDWGYSTVANGKTNQASLNESVPWPRGKMLGGSSSINAMIYIKGNTADYQKWYDDGNKHWHPKIVSKYFKKAESFQNEIGLQNAAVADTYGHDGPLTLNYFNSTSDFLTEALLNSYDEIGIKKVPDVNAANVLGAGFYSATAANGRRVSTAKGYLNPIKDRSNFKIIKNTLVTKILINEKTLEAYGVEVDRNGEKAKYYASLEVILSAGAINTPQLLMLSGVGPKEHLISKGITNILESPNVGQHLQDHNVVPVTILGNRPEEQDPFLVNIDILTFLYNSTGFLSTNTVSNILAFYSSIESATYPQYQNHLAIFPKNNDQLKTYLATLYKQSVVESVVEQNKNNAVYYFMFNLLHPHSRGKITLKSNDPKDAPLIFANYFEDSRDLQATADGIRMLTRITETKFFKSINGTVGRIKWPACDDLVLDSEDYWKCIAMNMVTTIYHPVATAKMGSDIETSVVDSRLKVHGVGKLRVIDASVMPYVPSGNTNGPVIMIAERACDLIKKEYKVCRKQTC